MNLSKLKIVTVDDKNKKILRKQIKELELTSVKKKELRELVKTMRSLMKKVNGIGLSANKVGLDMKFFVAQVTDEQGRLKFYTIINPEITKTSTEEVEIEEGCLSVPGKHGLVKRPKKITLTGFNISGKKIKINAWDLLARVFQHEVDHLDGKLIIDKCEKVYSTEEEELEDTA